MIFYVLFDIEFHLTGFRLQTTTILISYKRKSIAPQWQQLKPVRFMLTFGKLYSIIKNLYAYARQPQVQVQNSFRVH